jgi:hypothetical protein
MAGLAFDMSGSYQIVFLLFIANYLIAATLTCVAREPSYASLNSI